MDNDLITLAALLLAFRALDEWQKGPAEALKKAGSKAYDTLHDDEAHKQDLPGKQLTRAQLTELAERAGFPDPRIAVAIALAESGGVPNALGDSGVSVGLWQINTRAHPKYSRAHLAIPFNNALAAYEISKGGTDWSPWSVYKSGSYLRYL